MFENVDRRMDGRRIDAGVTGLMRGSRTFRQGGGGGGGVRVRLTKKALTFFFFFLLFF